MPSPRKQNHVVLWSEVPCGPQRPEGYTVDHGNLAGYYCPKLYVPKPHILHSRTHNDGNDVSADLTWMDFVEMRFVDDGTLAVYEVQDPVNPNIFPRVDLLLTDLANQWDTRIVSNAREQFTAHISQVHNLTLQQIADPANTERFVWGVEPVMYHFRDQMSAFFEAQRQEADSSSIQSHLMEERCQYTMKQVPSILANLTSQAFREIQEQIPSDVYGGLHVRRGDSVDACNTTLSKMASFVPCSFAGTERTRIGVLFYSNKRDLCYCSAIQRLFNSMENVKAVDLDRGVEAVLQAFCESECIAAKATKQLFCIQNHQ